MSKVYNFSAGPSMLPEPALQAAAKAAIDYNGCGMSLMTMSHRSKPIVAMFAETEALLREALDIPQNFKVLFLQGGASLQFCMVPMNLLPQDGCADYTITGVWAKKAAKEAKLFGKVNEACSSAEATFSYIPKDLKQDPKATYLHVTSNNTIYGTEWKSFPKPANPDGYLVVDMSSDILSRKFDWTNMGLVYAGAQKNMGPAGVTIAIVRDDILGKGERTIPTMLSYATHIEGESMFNTPPVFSVYVVNETLKWVKSVGGVDALHQINERKAAKLYKAIADSSFFKNPVAVEDRSPMNVTFVPTVEGHDEEFIDFCKARGLMQLKGHRSVGGFRASIYNAMPEEGVDALIEAMKDFEKKL